MKKMYIDEEELRDLYDTSKLSMRAIAKYYDVPYSTIFGWMERYGIKRRTRRDAAILKDNKHRKYAIDKDFFKTWTGASAWLYGWALGDGWFKGEYILEFGLERGSEEVLYKFKNCLKSEHLVVQRKLWSKECQKWRYQSRVVFSSKELISDLKRLDYLMIPNYFMSHFIRGFWEAEGSVYWAKNSSAIRSQFTNNNRELLEYIHWCLRDLFVVVEGGSLHYHGETGNELVFGKYDTLKFYEFIYKDCGTNYLLIKKEKFDEILKKMEERNE